MNIDQMIKVMSQRIENSRQRIARAESQVAWRKRNKLGPDMKLNNQLREFREELGTEIGALRLLFEEKDGTNEPITESWFTFGDAVRGGKCHAERVSVSEMFFGGHNTDRVYQLDLA